MRPLSETVTREVLQLYPLYSNNVYSGRSDGSATRFGSSWLRSQTESWTTGQIRWVSVRTSTRDSTSVDVGRFQS